MGSTTSSPAAPAAAAPAGAKIMVASVGRRGNKPDGSFYGEVRGALPGVTERVDPGILSRASYGGRGAYRYVTQLRQKLKNAAGLVIFLERGAPSMTVLRLVHGVPPSMPVLVARQRNVEVPDSVLERLAGRENLVVVDIKAAAPHHAGRELVAAADGPLQWLAAAGGLADAVAAAPAKVEVAAVPVAALGKPLDVHVPRPAVQA